MIDRRTGSADFDFWLGDWECIWDGGHGTNGVTKELGGRVLVERFAVVAPEPFSGMSLTVFDPRTQRWRQSWADSEGNYWTLVGGPEGDDMVLTTVGPGDDEEPPKRMVFYDIAQDQLDWRWELSDDDRRTWQLLWHVRYRPAEGSTER